MGYNVIGPNGERTVYIGIHRDVTLVEKSDLVAIVNIEGDPEVWALDDQGAALNVRQYYHDSYGHDVDVIVYERQFSVKE